MPSDPRNPRHSQDRRIVEYDDKLRRLDLWLMDLVPPSVDIHDEPTRCYRVNEEWSKIVIGLVSWLAEIPVWRDAENEGYSAISQILKMMVGESCMSFQLRQNPDDSCLLEQTLDGGITWITVFDFKLCTSAYATNQQLQDGVNLLSDNIATYDGTVSSVAPDMVYDGSNDDYTRDVALCQALKELVEMMCQAELQHRQEIALAADLTAVMLAILGAIITVSTGGTATPFYLGVAAAIAGGFGTVFAGISDQILDNRTVQENVACCMFYALAGSTITQANFEHSLDNCNFDPLSFESQLAGAIVEMLTQENIYSTFLDYLERIYKLADLGLASCGCNAAWSHTFDFTVSDGGFIERNFIGDVGAVYLPGTGWSYKDATFVVGNDYRRSISIQKFFTQCNITKVKYVYNLTLGTVDSPLSTGSNINIFLNSTLQATSPLDYLNTPQGNNIIHENVASVSGDQVACYVSSSQQTVAAWNGSCLIKSCTIEGTGFNPFA